MVLDSDTVDVTTIHAHFPRTVLLWCEEGRDDETTKTQAKDLFENELFNNRLKSFMFF